MAAYAELTEGKRTIVRPGDTVPMPGLDITAVASAESYIQSNPPGSSIPNAACVDAQTMDESAYIDPDNGASAGLVLNFGRFRTVDLGELTWNGELDLIIEPSAHSGKGPIARQSRQTKSRRSRPIRARIGVCH